MFDKGGSWSFPVTSNHIVAPSGGSTIPSAMPKLGVVE